MIFKTHNISGFLFCLALLLACTVCEPVRAADAVAETEPVVAVAENKDDAIRDLGEGLFYFRVENLAGQIAGLRAALAKHPALVLDLRGASSDMYAARALRAALAQPADPVARVARFVLINRGTSSAIYFTLGAGLSDDAMPGVLVVAPSADSVPADIKAPGAPGEDQRACEAIAKGADITTLINRRPEKKRYDEAMLMRDYQGLPEPEAATSTPPQPDATAGDSGDAPKPVTDHVLQTATHAHRALLALKKL